MKSFVKFQILYRKEKRRNEVIKNLFLIFFIGDVGKKRSRDIFNLTFSLFSYIKFEGCQNVVLWRMMAKFLLA